jgi:hypothetical protein
MVQWGINAPGGMFTSAKALLRVKPCSDYMYAACVAGAVFSCGVQSSDHVHC